MDVSSLVTIVSAGGGSLGAILYYRRDQAKNKSDERIALKADERERLERVDNNLWKYLEEIKQDRAKIATDMATLQGLHNQVLERVEILEMQKVRDQQQIVDQQAQISQLQAELQQLRGTA